MKLKLFEKEINELLSDYLVHPIFFDDLVGAFLGTSERRKSPLPTFHDATDPKFNKNVY